MRAARLSFALALVALAPSTACSRAAFTGSSDAGDTQTTGSDGDGDDGPLEAGGGSPGTGAVDGSLVATSSDGIVGVGCSPETCLDRGVECGPTTDSCGHAVDCGSCRQAGATCDAGSCGCTPKTCAAVPSDVCDKVSDGCGGFIACHSCASGQFCGPDSKCTSTPCSMAPVTAGQCGFVSDGCGGSQDGVSCAAPQTCGGGTSVDICGCAPKTCEQAGASCGDEVDDGCGGHLSCGACSESPGTCVDHHCKTCVAVADPALGFEGKCAAADSSHPHAWACGCPGGVCDVPDTGCTALSKTSEHAVYCCTMAASTSATADGG